MLAQSGVVDVVTREFPLALKDEVKADFARISYRLLPREERDRCPSLPSAAWRGR